MPGTQRLGLIALMAGVGWAVSAVGGEQTELERTLVRGVYWPWERTQANAAAAGKELWQFADETMGFLRTELHCNVVWFVNGPNDPGRACDLAEKHGLKVLCGVLAHEVYNGITDDAALRRKLTTEVEPLKAKPGLGAYVLKDEPRTAEAELMEAVRRMLAGVDPARPSVVVSMTPDTEAYALRTGFPIACTDIYHFGGPRSPNIPNPAATSQATYRGGIEALNALAGRGGKTAWVMPQVFVDPWGPWWRDENGNVVIEPGAYWHWRMPTVAEMHWQTWEALRGGCKGVVYYVLWPPANPWRPDRGPMPERMQKRVEENRKANLPMARERIATGQPSDLLLPGGKPTPQSRAMAEDFAALERLAPLLVSLKPAAVPSVFAETPGATATFESPDDRGARYAVVVNDDVETARVLTLAFLPNVTGVENLADGSRLELRPEAVGAEGFVAATLTLKPGLGTVLKLQCRADSQLPLLATDFSTQTLGGVGLDKAERHLEARGYGMGSTWTVRKTGSKDEIGTVTIPLTRYVTGALRDAGQGKAHVYLLAGGAFPKPESLVVNFKDDKGKGGWNKTAEYHRPVTVPAGTATIELLLRTPAAGLTGVRVWRVSTPPPQATP